MFLGLKLLKILFWYLIIFQIFNWRLSFLTIRMIFNMVIITILYYILHWYQTKKGVEKIMLYIKHWLVPKYCKRREEPPSIWLHDSIQNYNKKNYNYENAVFSENYSSNLLNLNNDVLRFIISKLPLIYYYVMFRTCKKLELLSWRIYRDNSTMDLLSSPFWGIEILFRPTHLDKSRLYGICPKSLNSINKNQCWPVWKDEPEGYRSHYCKYCSGAGSINGWLTHERINITKRSIADLFLGYGFDGNIDGLKWLMSDRYLDIDFKYKNQENEPICYEIRDWICLYAAKNGKVNVLKWIFSNKFSGKKNINVDYARQLLKYAILGGSIDSLEYIYNFAFCDDLNLTYSQDIVHNYNAINDDNSSSSEGNSNNGNVGGSSNDYNNKIMHSKKIFSILKYQDRHSKFFSYALLSGDSKMMVASRPYHGGFATMIKYIAECKCKLSIKWFMKKGEKLNLDKEKFSELNKDIIEYLYQQQKQNSITMITSLKTITTTTATITTTITTTAASTSITTT
jgi:hypothetical protein